MLVNLRSLAWSDFSSSHGSVSCMSSFIAFTISCCNAPEAIASATSSGVAIRQSPLITLRAVCAAAFR